MKTLLLALIRFYRRSISPLRPPCCRFIPTCSEYALEAVEKYGALKGGWLALRRVARVCDSGKGTTDVQGFVLLMLWWPRTLCYILQNHLFPVPV